MRTTFISLRISGPAACYVFSVLGTVGAAALIAAAINNWSAIAGIVRHVITFGGFQSAPAVVLLVATGAMYGGWCASENTDEEVATSTLGEIFQVACWIIGAVGFCFTIGDMDTITVFQGTAAVIGGCGLLGPALRVLDRS